MQTPLSFVAFAKSMHQDIDLSVKNMEELPQYLLSQLTPREKIELKAFLQELVHPRNNNETIKAVWRKSNYNFIFTSDEALRDFFKLIITLIK